VTPQTVSKWRVAHLAPFKLRPHRQDAFELYSDPPFVEKVSDIVGLYMDPPLMAVVLCVDEKSQRQPHWNTGTGPHAALAFPGRYLRARCAREL
jgi:hypothetical protein